jgi:hypothetical protein
MVLDPLLPSIQPRSFLERIRTSFEQSVAEFYTILLEEYLQVALETLEVGICSSLWSPKLTTVFQWCSHVVSVTLLAREDVEVHLHAVHTMTEQLQLCEWGHCRLGKLSFFENNVWIMGCTWLPNLSTYSLAVIRSWRIIMGPTQYSTTILLPEPGIPDCRLPWVFSKQTLPDVGNSVKDDSPDYITRFQLSDVQVFCRDTIVYASEHYFQ